MITTEYFYKSYFKPGKISTDSRKIMKGDAFISLKGEDFNGNQYAAGAIQAGAAVALVDQEKYANGENIFYVNNCLSFLQNLANYHRKISKFKVIGITGSNGKTTTKELIFNVLKTRYNCSSTKGNLNNHIGVPLTLLSTSPDTELLILEMGANHMGEIKMLSEISDPDIGIITNIGKAHLEGFGSPENIVKAKSELFEYIKKNKKRIIYNGKDKLLTSLVNQYDNSVSYNTVDGSCRGKILNAESELKVEITDSDNNTEIVSTKLFGEYNFENILTATAIGLDLGLSLKDIKKGIESYIPENQRSQVVKIGSNTIILDCYNANPTSMRLSVSHFSNMKGTDKVLILGGMKELGKYSYSEHKSIGKLIETVDATRIILIGPEFEDIKIENANYFNDVTEAGTYFSDNPVDNSTVLIKGSRAIQLEKLLEVFR